MIEFDRRRLAGLLVTLVLLAVVLPFVVFAVPQVVGADESFVVLSGSMEPALSPGDVVIVDASAPIRAGDVITYTTGAAGVPTTHRVLSVQAAGYETKGDANENPDAGLVPPAAVIGRVLFVVPLVGHVLLWTNTGIGYVALVVVPLTLLGLTELLAWVGREDADSTGKADADDDPAEPTQDATPTPTSTVAVAAIDLKLTALAMGVLFAYAAWNVYREVVAVAAPNPVTVGALTGGLLGLLFTGWVTTSAWRRNRAPGAPVETSAPRTDGGEITEEDDA
jgi:signal peptidase